MEKHSFMDLPAGRQGVEVEWKKLGDVVEYSKTRIGFEKLNKDNYVGVDNLLQNREGKTISTKIPTKGNSTYYEMNDILIGNIRPYLKKIWFATHDGGTNGDVLVIRLTDDTLIPRYLYQILADDNFFIYNMAHAKGAKMPRGNKEKIMHYNIPIPPLEVQSEIVRILDNFTELTAELTAELSARKKQYTYYRDKLLSFLPVARLSGGQGQTGEEGEVEWKKLGDPEVGEFIRGKRFVKTDMKPEGIPCIHYGQMYTYYGIWANKSKSFVSPELVEAKKLRTAKKGDVIFVAAGETIEDIGMATAWFGDEDVVIHDACFFYKTKLNAKYIAYYTRTNFFKNQIRKSVSSGKISAINAKGLGKVIIPVPSPEEQDRIVAILDKFDTLTHSISEGLPKEIALRQKQYEYYRDLLLSFPKVGATDA